MKYSHLQSKRKIKSRLETKSLTRIFCRNKEREKRSSNSRNVCLSSASKIKKILSIVMFCGRKFAIVDVENSSNVHLIDLKVMKRKYPKLTMNFYEKCLKWKKLDFLIAWIGRGWIFVVCRMRSYTDLRFPFFFV